MIDLKILPENRLTIIRCLRSISIVASLFLLTSVANAGYSVLSGVPVTQGQMQVCEQDFQEIERSNPGASPTFLLQETRVDADISGVLAR